MSYPFNTGAVGRANGVSLEISWANSAIHDRSSEYSLQKNEHRFGKACLPASLATSNKTAQYLPKRQSKQHNFHGVGLSSYQSFYCSRTCDTACKWRSTYLIANLLIALQHTIYAFLAKWYVFTQTSICTRIASIVFQHVAWCTIQTSIF